MAVPNGYANPFPTFQRSMRLVSGITNALNAVVTTTFEHQYETGDVVRLYVPEGWGMRQANRLQAEIVVESSTTFSINADTTGFDIFVTPPNPSPLVNAVAHVVPVAEISGKLSSSTQNVLPYV